MSWFNKVYRFITRKSSELEALPIDGSQLVPFGTPEIKGDLKTLRSMRNEFVALLDKHAANYNKSFFIISGECESCDDPKFRFAQHCESKAAEISALADFVRQMKARRFEKWVNAHQDEYLSRLLSMANLYPELAA